MKSELRILAIASLLLALCAMTGAQFGGLLKHHKNDDKKDDKKSDTAVAVKLPPYFGPKKRIAVQDIDVKVTPTAAGDPGQGGGSNDTVSISPPTDFGQGLTDMLTTALVGTGRFIVLERSDKGMADIQKEQALQGVAQESKPEQNKLLGAQMLVRGSVTEFTYTRTGQNTGGSLLKGVDLHTAKTEAAVVIDVKLYDAATGEVFDSKKAEGRCKTSATNFNLDRGDLKVGNSNFQQSPLGQATREAIEKAVLYICESMDKKPWEGRIATVVDEGDGARLYLNVGSRAGVKVGDEFDVFTEGEAVTDPDTGKVLSHTKGKKIGRCRVESVEDEISIAKPTEGEGFAAKNFVRYADKAPAAPAATP